MSAPEPAPIGSTTRTGRVGQFCAADGSVASVSHGSARRVASNSLAKRFMSMTSVFAL
jgi:hypothetical protein